MSALHNIDPKPQFDFAAHAQQMALREHRKSLMLRAWILAGLFFMVLPGTVLGFTNLIAISRHHGLSALPPAWIQGHGHAQLFGWIGSFILGIGFYSQPAHGRSVLKTPLISFLLWTSGVALRWFANIYLWHWRTLFVVSATAELIAFLLFFNAARRHKRSPSTGSAQAGPRMPVWMIAVFLGTAGFLATLLFNFVECLRLALAGVSPAFPHNLDQRYLIVAAWAFLVPTVWGFSARWLPTFLGIAQPASQLFRIALLVDTLGILVGVTGLTFAAAILLAAASVAVVFALQLTKRPQAPAKTLGIHPSFPVFIRVAYAWLVVASLMGIWASLADQHGGIWGASRHALTVGFAATMVFAIGPRILPHFGGVYNLFSSRLMFFSLSLLEIGCTLRVSCEPLAYEGFSSAAWTILPSSATLELAAVTLFALNILLTYSRGRAFFAAGAPSFNNAA
jgi:uncharacterized protein involved in response to NO